jgi:hypothetical protein
MPQIWKKEIDHPENPSSENSVDGGNSKKMHSFAL